MKAEIQTVTSPWEGRFIQFVRSIKKRAMLVAPFITKEPLQRLAKELDCATPPRIEIITALTPERMLDRSLDLRAIADLCRQFPDSAVRAIPHLHAKVYIADEHTAIVTSGNLTANSMRRNCEYGIEINAPSLVRRIADDMREFGALGYDVSLAELEKLADSAITLKQKHDASLNSARADAKREFDLHLQKARDSLQHLRAAPGEKTSSIFKRTIRYLLKAESLTTAEMHSRIQKIHPDICDDNIEHITIDGVHFGKKWKHNIRNAQQALKKEGVAQMDGNHWRLR